MIEAVVIFLLLFTIVREYLNQLERKKLMEMVMAKNLPEFKEAEKEEKRTLPPELVQPDLMPMETVTDEQFTEAIQREAGTLPTKKRRADALKQKLGKKVYGD